MSAKLGLSGKFYRLTSGSRATWGAATAGISIGPAPSNLDEVTPITDVALKTSKGEADVSTRGNNGWEATLGTLKKASIELKAVWDPADTDLQAFLGAYLQNTNMACAMLDGDKAAVGVQGFWADFQVIGFDKDEPLQNAQMVTITIKPALGTVPPEWVQIAAGS